MIEFDQIFCEDLRDDFEEAGIINRLFTLEEFIRNDLSRAFAFGYCIIQWKEEGLWIPPSIRKKVRHIQDSLSIYNSKLSWINNRGEQKTIIEYVDYVLANIFFSSEEDKIKVAIALGLNIRASTNGAKKN